MNERDTTTVKIILLWILAIVAILEVAIMVDVDIFIDAQNGITETIEIVPDTKY
jgi:hypothetical protein